MSGLRWDHCADAGVNETEEEAKMSTEDNRRDGRTIAPSHHPMPGVDDAVIDVGKRDDGILPPADAKKEVEIDWDDREHDVGRLPEAADVIKRGGGSHKP